jgi:hypothetical protein
MYTYCCFFMFSPRTGPQKWVWPFAIKKLDAYGLADLPYITWGDLCCPGAWQQACSFPPPPLPCKTSHLLWSLVIYFGIFQLLPSLMKVFPHKYLVDLLHFSSICVANLH